MGVLVGRQAPDFTAAAVLGNGEIVDAYNLHESIKGKKAVIFFYPLDFTFVCPSELIAFDKRFAEFQKRGVEVIGVSIDSQFSHNAWRNTPVNEGGIGPVQYPLIADVKHDICQAYDVEHPEAGVAFRGSFLIDEAGVVRHQVINDLPLGRDIDEMLRMVDALAIPPLSTVKYVLLVGLKVIKAWTQAQKALLLTLLITLIHFN